MELKGKRAIVTGGALGIGNQIATRLAAEGSVVMILDKEEPNDEFGFVACDVSQSQGVLEAVFRIDEVLGGIDILVNNAGIMHSELLTNMGSWSGQVEKWNEIIATNLSSVFYVTAQVISKMIRRRTKGVIVNISSVCAAGNAGQSAYSASKAGVNALTATWAKELAPWGIRVVGIAPGYTNTEGMRQAMGESVLDDIVKRVPSRRLASPGEIADGVLWAIKNDFFNGKILQLDGGLVL